MYLVLLCMMLYYAFLRILSSLSAILSKCGEVFFVIKVIYSFAVDHEGGKA